MGSEATGDGQEPLAFGSSQVAGDEQKAILEHVTDGLLNGCAFARQAARRFIFGRWSAAFRLSGNFRGSQLPDFLSK